MRVVGRPRSELRCAVVAQAQGATLRDIQAATGASYGKVRQVLSNGVRAGELTYSVERREHSRRPVAVYKVRERSGGGEAAGWMALGAAWRAA
jgi:hypothetical protein